MFPENYSKVHIIKLNLNYIVIEFKTMIKEGISRFLKFATNSPKTFNLFHFLFYNWLICFVPWNFKRGVKYTILEETRVKTTQAWPNYTSWYWHQLLFLYHLQQTMKTEENWQHMFSIPQQHIKNSVQYKYKQVKPSINFTM